MNENYVFFWGGFLSNWHPAQMNYKGKFFYNSEQAYMWEKALYFDDEESAEEILKTSSPSEAKKLGRKVKGFDTDEWNKVSYNIMYEVCLEKFKQNKDLKKYLIDTNEKILVEASPYDKIWGIGLNEERAKRTEPSKWEGMNWLGKVLMDVRKEI